MVEIKPRYVTAEEVRAVSAKDVIYAKGAEALIKRGVWILIDPNTPRGD